MFRRSITKPLVLAIALCAYASAQPINYARQIAPIFALHCNSCHSGPTAVDELDTSTHDGLIDGGTLGPAVQPGDPGKSVLVEFVEGRRGEGHRMPLGGKPLTGAQIATIRQWIKEGAQGGGDAPSGYIVPLGSIAFQPRKFLRVSCRSPLDAYLTLDLADGKGTSLHSEHAAVKQDKDAADAGRPGDWVTWSVWSEPGWPPSIIANVTIAYTEGAPVGAECLATYGASEDYHSVTAASAITRPHDKDSAETGAVKFWAPEPGDVLIGSAHHTVKSAGMQTVKSSEAAPLRLTFTPANDQRNWFILAVLTH